MEWKRNWVSREVYEAYRESLENDTYDRESRWDNVVRSTEGDHEAAF